MTKITEQEILNIKQGIPLVKLIGDKGHTLKKHGKDWAISCPLHEDKTPSLIITPSKNLWHCMSCDEGGSNIDFLMKTEKLSFLEAINQLKPFPLVAKKPSSKSHFLQGDKNDVTKRVMDYYHKVLKQSPEALNYLKSRGLNHPELIDTFKLGFSDKTLGKKLPVKQVKEGKRIRSLLQEIGLLKKTGFELFNGSIVFPIFDENQNITEIYGRKINHSLREGTAYHLYLPGPHKGIFNLAALKASKKIILCEAIIDALTFWCHGYRNVTASYGASGFTKDHLRAFKQYRIEQVYIAYDRDVSGEKAATKLAEQLELEGIECYLIQFPLGMDANRYVAESRQKNNILDSLVANAKPFSKKKKPPPPPVEEKPKPSNTQIMAKVEDHEITIPLGDRVYRVRGLDKNLSYNQLKVNLHLRKNDFFHVDSLDLYSARHRAVFISQASKELKINDDILKKDLGKVLLKLEELQDKQIKTALNPDKKEIEISDSDRKKALDLLKDPELLSRILDDFNLCGVVGEEINKLTGYLAAVSRKMDQPLAIIIQSSSAAGKSSLMDAVLAMMPEEEKVQYSAMTGQSLFYMGEQDLKHKILAIAEEEGVQQASYALKVLQSQGELTIASTGKDPTTGKLITHEYRVEGPIMLFLTTTAIELDEELVNRCVVLTVNESMEQTQQIHKLQREEETLEGLIRKESKKDLISLHRNAGRLLKSLKVINPYADKLSFVSSQTRTRRDHKKYLALIRSIALLHQYQREVKTISHSGNAIKYIEVEPSDIEIAGILSHEVLGRSLDELPAHTRKFLIQIYEMVREACKIQQIDQTNFRFSRKEVRDACGLSHEQVRVHLGRLTEMEYVLIHKGGRGQSFYYELLYDGKRGSRPYLPGLIDSKNLKSIGMMMNLQGLTTRLQGSNRPQTGSEQAPNRSDKIDLNKAIKGDSENNAKNLLNNIYREKKNIDAIHHIHTSIVEEANGSL